MHKGSNLWRNHLLHHVHQGTNVVVGFFLLRIDGGGVNLCGNLVQLGFHGRLQVPPNGQVGLYQGYLGLGTRNDGCLLGDVG